MEKRSGSKMIPRRIENVKKQEAVVEVGRHAGLSVMKFPDSEKLGVGGYRLTCARMILSKPFEEIERLKESIRFTEEEVNVIVGLIEASREGDIKVSRREVENV